MNRTRIPFWFCTALLAVVAWTAAAATAGTAKSVVAQPRHDFGSVYAGSAVTHTFFIENPGDAPLILKSVRTG